MNGQGLRNGSSRSCGCLKRDLLSKQSLKNISGERFGRLTVLNQHKIKGSSGYWFCRCDCGAEKWIGTSALSSNAVKSCGCLRKEIQRKTGLGKRKKYKVVLTTEQRRNFENQQTLSAEEIVKNKVLLLSDHSLGALTKTDTEIADILEIGERRVFYIRAVFSDPGFKSRNNEKQRQRLSSSRAKELRREVQRRYESKPETKLRIRQYRLNRPPEIKAHERERAKLYHQTEQGKAARAREAVVQRLRRQSPEGKAKTKIQHQRYKARINKWYSTRYYNDPRFRIHKRLSGRLRDAIRARGGRKSLRIGDLIGCSVEKLITIVEGKFKTGMTWKNYGSWHIDHIIPCSYFDLSKLDEQKRCFHFSNLQPLWAAENRTKSDKLLPSIA